MRIATMEVTYMTKYNIINNNSAYSRFYPKHMYALVHKHTSWLERWKAAHLKL
jgi:hypothetical protein